MRRGGGKSAAQRPKPPSPLRTSSCAEPTAAPPLTALPATPDRALPDCASQVSLKHCPD
eukprot:CAMPEP_0179901412 /NCGR_PEP_ID=MMETSP0982-20121206/39764_1 /TAXON_ID=483367 /ORGANISM="non described non described, Strain CCMP 2436" /LENGTH=58 /DNA_ID=CAMNT_0021799985 /DNA_START=33 /DNA_END=207 /DNA_ORIENTATION=+